MQLGGWLHNIYRKHCPVTELRRQVGMVLQIPNPLPMSIYKNVAPPLLLKGGITKETVRTRVVEVLQKVRPRDKVQDRLHSPALHHSGATAIEQLLLALKESCTLLLVSHYLDQVTRIADTTFELQDGRLVRLGDS